MSEERDRFAQLMQRVREGCDEAAQEVWEQFGTYVIRVVRRQLQRKLRSKFDSEDFAQAIWGSFFADRFAAANFDSPESLISFLTQVARNKVADECRRRLSGQKHNINQEHSLDGSAAWVLSVVGADDPTPSEVLVKADERDELLAPYSYRSARVLDLLMSGYATDEIAEYLQVHAKTVRRILQRIAERSKP